VVGGGVAVLGLLAGLLTGGGAAEVPGALTEGAEAVAGVLAEFC
jgi:hypothetical protein